MLTSKEVLERTGISRATLNNYISSGLVARPEVLPPQPSDGGAPRIGYFPPETVQRIQDIQRLKREGWSIGRITEHFTGKAALDAPPARPPARPAGPAVQAAPMASADVPPVAPATSRTAARALPGLSFGQIAHPAYLLNHRFQLVWLNEAAAAATWPNAIALPAQAPAQGLLSALLDERAANPAVSTASRQAILRLHLELARQRAVPLADWVAGLPATERAEAERLLAEPDTIELPMIVRLPVLPVAGGPSQPLFLYALSFLEGTLFIYVPGGLPALDLSRVLAPAAPTPGPALVQAPQLTDVAVLSTDLQDSARLWSELAPQEYFELVNDIWQLVEPIFARHQGTTGKHPAEGMVCYFLPQSGRSHLWNALAAAQELREAMRALSKQWRLRMGWGGELFMNTGIAEGQEWHGQLRPGPQAEFTVLGDAPEQAAAISRFARNGSVWVTRSLVGKLGAAERARLQYGARRHETEGVEPAAAASTFARVEDLADLSAPGHESLKPIARLAVTEILDIDVSTPRPKS